MSTAYKRHNVNISRKKDYDISHTLFLLLFNSRKNNTDKTNNHTSTLTIPSSFRVKYLVCKTGVLVSNALKEETSSSLLIRDVVTTYHDQQYHR